AARSLSDDYDAPCGQRGGALGLAPFRRSSPALSRRYAAVKIQARERQRGRMQKQFIRQGRLRCAVLHWRPRWSRYSFPTWGHPRRSKLEVTTKRISSPTNRG